MSHPSTNTAPAPTEACQREQKLRTRRLGMSFGSYMVTFSIVVYCWAQGLISLGVTVGFLVFASLINATFWWLIHTGRNLKFQDPSMTSAQMIVSLLPPIWVMAFLEAGQAGDTILQAVAHSVKDGLRTIDCFGRYGGEEFLLVLPQTPLDGARIKSERVREAIERLTFPDIGDNFRVTVSIGVAEYHREESTDDTLLRADQALYAAKGDGRNNVKLASAPAETSQKSSLSAPNVRPV